MLSMLNPNDNLIAATLSASALWVALLAPFLSACDTQPPAQIDEGVVRADPPPEARPTGETKLRTVYVPAYSHLPPRTKSGDKKFLSVLLSVRNVDSEAAITLTHVDYFDTSGERVRRYLSTSRVLQPLETAEFSVADQDLAGGSGANFLVYWEGPADAHALLTEAVMHGASGSGYFSFASRGVELDRRPQQDLFDAGRERPKTPQGDDEPVADDAGAGEGALYESDSN